MNNITHASVFTGIGGFDYAASAMGWDNVLMCENDKFCQSVLKYHFPKAKLYGDITKTDFTPYRHAITVLSGGFPCQPFSVAGKQKGKEDNRYLWPQMLRAIREIKPPFVVCENVTGIIKLALPQVLSDLEAEGYTTEAFIIPAASVDAPHRRYRVWIIAYTNIRSRQEHEFSAGRNLSEKCDTEKRDATYTECKRIKKSIKNSQTKQLNKDGKPEGIFTDTDQLNANISGLSTGKTTSFKTDKIRRNFTSGFQNFPTQSPLCSRDDGLSYGLDGITFSKWRNESIKAYGNAIVPQIVFNIFTVIQQIINNHE